MKNSSRGRSRQAEDSGMGWFSAWFLNIRNSKFEIMIVVTCPHLQQTHRIDIDRGMRIGLEQLGMSQGTQQFLQ